MSKNFDLSWKIKNLQAEAKRLKISYAGTKSELVKRLNIYLREKSYEEAPAPDQVNESIEETEASESHDKSDNELENVSIRIQHVQNDEEELVTNSNGKRVRAFYQPVVDFEDEVEALGYMKSENWKKERKRESSNGDKWWFYCRKTCPVRAYLLLNDYDNSFTLFKSEIEHNHNEEVKAKKGIDDLTKAQIDICYGKRLTTARR